MLSPFREISVFSPSSHEWKVGRRLDLFRMHAWIGLMHGACIFGRLDCPSRGGMALRLREEGEHFLWVSFSKFFVVGVFQEIY